MFTIPETIPNAVDNRELNAALATMPETEVIQMINSIRALQVDLQRLMPFLNDAESVEEVIYAQELLKILNDEITRYLVAEMLNDFRDRLRYWNKGE